jgi:hypothetical protein
VATASATAILGGKYKITAASVQIDGVLDWRSSDGDAAKPHLPLTIHQWNFRHYALEILDSDGQGMALTGIALVVLESAKDLTIWQVRECSRWIKRLDDIRNGMSIFHLENFNIHGAIAAIEIVTLAQRDGEMWLLRVGGGRNEKRGNGKEYGETEMHLVERNSAVER